MALNTTKGYPYPEGTDEIRSGDETIKALAEAVDTKLGLVQSGTVTVNVTTGGTAATAAVTFPVAFPGVPNVVVGIVGTNAATTQAALSQTPTATGVTVSAVRATSGNITCSWIAHYGG